MTKRFQNFKAKQKIDAQLGKTGLLEAIKAENETRARRILLEKGFDNLEFQDKKRDGK